MSLVSVPQSANRKDLGVQCHSHAKKWPASDHFQSSWFQWNHEDLIISIWPFVKNTLKSWRTAGTPDLPARQEEAHTALQSLSAVRHCGPATQQQSEHQFLNDGVLPVTVILTATAQTISAATLSSPPSHGSQPRWKSFPVPFTDNWSRLIWLTERSRRLSSQTV